MELVLASNNPNKLTEVQRILSGINILTPADFGIRFAYEEDGNTFDQNALGKARHLFCQLGVPTVADDSGLCVTALKGAPGIHSARFGPPDHALDDRGRCKYLLRQLGASAERSATFICCVAIILDQNKLIILQDSVTGEITWCPQGTFGFGYDPVFLLPQIGRTMAQLTEKEKDKVSHRGRTLRQAAICLNDT